MRCLLLTLIGTLVVAGAAHAAKIHGPLVVWQNDPCTTATLVWVEENGAAAPGKFTVLTDGAPPRAATVGTFATSPHAVHRVKLGGLSPSGLVKVELRDESGMVAATSFRTAPAKFTAGMRFVSGGDMYHQRPLLDAMNRRAGAEDPVFAWLGGDLAYANNKNPKRWMEWMDSWVENAVTPDGRAVPMVLVIGNHEVEGTGYRPKDAPPPEKADEFYTLFEPANRKMNYTLDFGDYLSLVMLDSGHTANIAAQTAWLGEALAARQAVPRLMVNYHRPAWGSGVKDTDAVDIQREWCPLFEQNRVDVVFENDLHTHKRTHPLLAGKPDEANGVLYLGDGAWGVQVRSISPKMLAERPYISKAISVNHLWRVTLGREGFLYEALDADGKVIDETSRPLRRQ